MVTYKYSRARKLNAHIVIGYVGTYTATPVAMRDVTRTIIWSEINPIRTIRTEEPNVIIYLPICVTSGLSSVAGVVCFYRTFTAHLSVGCCCAFIICSATIVLIILGTYNIHIYTYTIRPLCEKYILEILVR